MPKAITDQQREGLHYINSFVNEGGAELDGNDDTVRVLIDGGLISLNENAKYVVTKEGYKYLPATEVVVTETAEAQELIKPVISVAKGIDKVDINAIPKRRRKKSSMINFESLQEKGDSLFIPYVDGVDAPLQLKRITANAYNYCRANCIESETETKTNAKGEIVPVLIKTIDIMVYETDVKDSRGVGIRCTRVA